ncbi:MAG: uracil-DNA glycosylase, partial [Rhodobacteraceae bacterium]|nr:uracil-DNA glycosylase [Paracoccaceae bacterium]
MGISADILDSYDAALAALVWQLELGATEAMLDAPQSAYELPD